MRNFASCAFFARKMNECEALRAEIGTDPALGDQA